MGRQTWILHTSIYDDEEGKTVTNPNEEFKTEMIKKYNIYEYCWIFGKYGDITFRKSPYSDKRSVYGEVEDHVKVLLETAQKYNRKICGTLSYYDDQSGGAYSGIIYIAKNYTAMHHEFNTDINVETLDELGNSFNYHKTKKITLE